MADKLTSAFKAAKAIIKGGDDAPAVNRIDMSFKDVTKRVPELTEAANMLARNELTTAQYDAMVRRLKPVTPYNFVPQPATAKDAMRALNEGKRQQFGKASEMTAGEQADLRLDIPAYKDHGVWVNSIHRKNQPTVYGSTSSVKNATMIGAPDKALKVAQGAPKAPFAVIRGDWNPMDEAAAVENAQKYLNHPEWKQVGYDPERHGFFYDRASMAPVLGAEEVIQIGPLVLAKNPKYGKLEDFPFKQGGLAHFEKGGRAGAFMSGLKALSKLADDVPPPPPHWAVHGLPRVPLPPPVSLANKERMLAESMEKRRMYHGTRHKPQVLHGQTGTSQPLTEYDWQGNVVTAKPMPPIPEEGLNSIMPSQRRGLIFTTPDPEFASDYASGFGGSTLGGGQVYPVRVHTKNPFDYENPEHVKAVADAMRYGKESTPLSIAQDATREDMLHALRTGDWAYIEDPEVLNTIRRLGFDGAYMREADTKNLGVFRPEQVKSDIGNIGTYDVTNPDMTKRNGGLAHADKSLHMQVGGLGTLARLGKSGTTLSKADVATLRARGLGVPGVDFADPFLPPSMRMSEALGNVGAEGKILNFTEADRSRVFGPNRGGVGFSTLQHYSEPHKQAGSVWGFGKQSVAQKKINQTDPDNTIWTTYAGSPDQHKSNTVVVKDAVQTLQDANRKGTVNPKQLALINDRIRLATDKNGKPLFSEGFDITDPKAMDYATTFDRRSAISDALLGVGVKKPMISKEFKAENPGVKWSDDSNISGILTRETDPVLVGANTFDVGPNLFTMEKNIIHRPDLNEAFPYQVTGQDLGMRFEPAPFRYAATDFMGKKGYGPNDLINAWALSRGNPRQFVSDKYLTNLQKEGYKDGGDVSKSFDQRLKEAIGKHMAEGGEVSQPAIKMPITSLRQLQKFDEGGAAYGNQPMMRAAQNIRERRGIESPEKQQEFSDKVSAAIRKRAGEQYEKEKATLSTPAGRRDTAMGVVANTLGTVPDLFNLGLEGADLLASQVPAFSRPESVMNPQGSRVAASPMASERPYGGSRQWREAFQGAGLMGDDGAPVTEFVGSMLAPAAIAKAPRAIEGGLNAATAAARRPFIPATITTEAVAPDLAKFKSRDWQDLATKKMIGEEGVVPMDVMGGRRTTHRPGQGVYLNDDKVLELNPMIGIDVPGAGNLSKNRALRADIATAGGELNQEAMAAHRFVPMATNQIRDASAMMISGPGGRALTRDEVIRLGDSLPGMIVTHSPRTGGVMVAPFEMQKGKIPAEFLEAQKVANMMFGKKADIRYGKAEPNKDLMYMHRSTYAEEGARPPSPESQAMRTRLKKMERVLQPSGLRGGLSQARPSPASSAD
jgi:hypothetical protein